MTRIVALDTECTGPDPDLHEIWEVGAIVVEDGELVSKHHWFLPVDLGRADPAALKIGKFYERHPMARESWRRSEVATICDFAREFEQITRGAHLLGNVISFDEERLRKLLKANGACPDWHYHLVDIEPMVVGYLEAQGFRVSLPWDSDKISRKVGVSIPEEERHTALGDAKWALMLYEGMMG